MEEETSPAWSPSPSAPDRACMEANSLLGSFGAEAWQAAGGGEAAPWEGED